MREYFEQAFDTVQEFFIYTVIPLVDSMIKTTKIIFVYCTLPLWIIPYVVFFRNEKENDAEDL